MTAASAVQPSASPLWWQASRNTAACLLGCSIGDFGTIYAFQVLAIGWPALGILALAMLNGILTSIALETAILVRAMTLRDAFRTAVGMSLLSMLAMEAAMNAVDLALVGEARIVWWAIPPMLAAGFVVPWPYNYWRLRVLGKACH